ncbi:MAG TPA: monovalent cation/H+ antiporter subunit D family protein, partial [Gemmatimonadetes bacterium]|nr:monovalent cation/H+ antiporter subunit D family protein [Gemmatimonadota bacterium]
MSHHLPVLLVVVPLVAAPVVALLNRPRISWAVAVAVTLWVLYAALALLSQTMVDGEIHYALGGWVAPYGIEYVVDPVNAWVIVIVALIGALVTPYARMSVEREISEDRIPLFYAAFILCLTGLLGIAVTGDVFNVFVFLEISSLSAYALIALGKDRRALTASFQYLIMGSVGATFIVIGIGLMYVMTGTLNIADLCN